MGPWVCGRDSSTLRGGQDDENEEGSTEELCKEADGEGGGGGLETCDEDPNGVRGVLEVSGADCGLVEDVDDKGSYESTGGLCGPVEWHVDVAEAAEDGHC